MRATDVVCGVPGLIGVSGAFVNKEGGYGSRVSVLVYREAGPAARLRVCAFYTYYINRPRPRRTGELGVMA